MMPRRIEILVFPDAQVLDATGPAQVFASANELSRGADKEPLYEIALVAEAAEVICNSGITLRCQPLPEGVNRRPKRTPYRRAKGTPFVEQRDGYDGRFVRAGCGVGRA